MKSKEAIALEKQRKETSAVTIVRFALDHQSELYRSHFNELISLAIWKFTEADGSKYRGRYITRAAMNPNVKQQHEHVIPRLTLRTAMLRHPHKAEIILRLAIACVVTPEEHQRLDGEAFGWWRYRDLGIDVVDSYTTNSADLDALARELDNVWRSLEL